MPSVLESATGKPPHRLSALLRSHAVFAAIIVFMIVIAAICLIDAVEWIDRPFAGFLYYKYPVVGSYANYDWSGMQAGIRYRDIVLQVNGRPISSGRDIDEAVSRTSVGHPIQYLIDRKESRVLVDVRVARFHLGDFLQIFGLTFLGGVVFWSIGAIVYFIKPNTAPTWAFLLFCLFLGTYFVTGFAVQSTPYAFWNYLNRFSMCLFPAAAVHLSLLFPERAKWVQQFPRIQLVPYLVAVVPMVAHHLDLLAIARAGLNADEFIAVSSRLLRTLQATRVYAFVAAVAIVLASAHAYWRSASIIAKQRARVVLLGSAVAFLPATVAMPFAAVVRTLIPFNVLAIPVIAFPAAIGYAVARHNLFDVDVYVKRAAGYGIMTAIVGLGYFGIQTATRHFVLAPVFGAAGERLYPLLFAVLVVCLFNPVQQRVQGAVDTLFFRKRFDYKGTITDVSAALTSMLKLDDILTRVVHTIRTQMFIDTVGIIVLNTKKQSCLTFFVVDDAAHPGGRPQETPMDYDDPLLALLGEEKALITRFAVEEDARYHAVREACLASFARTGATLIIPILYQDELIGMIALGEKKSGQFYTRDDVDLLTTMAAQAAVATQNAAAHEDVVRYAEELAASLRKVQILESMKANLSKFVPKTVQDLIEQSPEAPLLDKHEADLSVLFADITGYTRLSTQMELQQVNRLVERYFGAFLDEILRNGGDVNETAGDGLMVIFRDPDPAQHARAAVLAALGIQRRTDQINDELRGQFQSIAMHVGVNSGVASVGATKIEGVAGARWTYTASGPTTNIAARLAALGEAGCVVLSGETWRRLGDEFDAEDLGSPPLKNVDHPVRVYKIKVTETNVAGPAHTEHRRYPRRPVSWPVRIWIGDESFEGRAIDAGVYGFCVTKLPIDRLSIDQSYDVEILTDMYGDVRCLATVRELSDRGVGMETKDPLPVS